MTQNRKKSSLDTFNFESFQEEAIAKLQSGQSLTGKGGVLTPLIKQLIEASLEGEIEHHLDTCQDTGAPNRRNGKSSKTIQSASGPVEINTPRDRAGSFEPEIIKKRQTVLNESLDNKILGLYGLGMSYQDIRNHMNEMYGTEVSQGLLTKITDKLLPVITEWRNRPLESVYPIVFLDGLKGFPEAIKASFPKTEIQLCVVHQIRHSIKYIASKDQKEFMFDLKKVYKAETKDLAEHKLLELDEKWGEKYPMVLRSWQNKWDELSAYFKYSAEIRRLVYTTNSIEGFHRQVRKFTKSKGAFTSENALVKLIYSAYERIKSKWNQPMPNWALIISQLDIYFEGRLKIQL